MWIAGAIMAGIAVVTEAGVTGADTTTAKQKGQREAGLLFQILTAVMLRSNFAASEPDCCAAKAQQFRS